MAQDNKRGQTGLKAMAARTAGCIIAHRNDRMGGRLIAMINAMRIADTLGLPFRVGWTTHGRTSPEIKTPEDIFAPDFIADHFINGEQLNNIWADLVDLAEVTDTEPDALISAARNGVSYLSEIAIGAIVLPWETQSNVRAALPAVFRQIRFSDTVQAAMDAIDAQFAGLSLRAYHIRRGDIISDPVTSDKLWPNKYIPREFYQIHIEDFLATGGDRCLVFSDTPAEIDRLKGVDNRVVCFDDFVPAEGLKAGQRDILELYVMSKCPQIYGPPESAFSQTAATIGGGEVFAVQSSLPAPAQARAIDVMAQRMQDPDRYFLGQGDLGQNFPFLISALSNVGQADTARKLIEATIVKGMDRSYAYTLLCRLHLQCDDLPAVRRLQDILQTRPLVAEQAMAEVYAHGALADMQDSQTERALQHIHAAYWMFPLDRSVHGILNIMLTRGWLSDATMYPHDSRLIRNKGRLWPQNNADFDRLHALAMAQTDGRFQAYPWDLALRDWRDIHGKKLNRAFGHKGKITNEMNRLIKSSSKIAGSAQLESAVSVYQRAIGDLKAAATAAREAEAAYPEDALYAKRHADVLFEAGEIEKGLRQAERAAALSGDNIYFLADLGFWYGRARKGELAYKTFQKIAETPTDCIEINFLVSDFLRRRPATREQALDVLGQTMRQAHGSLRLLTAKARLLLSLERLDEAETIYLTIARKQTAPSHVFAQMFRVFAQHGAESRARSILAETQYAPEEVIASLNP